MGQPLTHQMVAREAAAMLAEENFVGAQINTDREEEFGTPVQGYKKGDTVRIKVPPVPVVYSGATFAGGGASAPAANESSVSLVINKQKHAALTFGAKEKALELSEFKARFLRPCMNSLIAIINADLLLDMKNGCPNAVQLTATPRTGYRNASSVLDRFLCPVDQRRVHISSDANDALAEQNATLFLPSGEIAEEFERNRIGQFSTLDFYVNQSLPVQSNGAGAGYLTNGAGADGSSSLAVNTGAGAINQGAVFTIAGVNAVHPLTGVSLGRLKQFVVTANYAGGAGNIAFAPAFNLTVAPGAGTGKVGNIDALPAGGVAVTILANAAGKASNIAFHRNAMAAAFPPLAVLASCEGYTATVKNISVRVMTFGDGKADAEHTRVDVLYGDVPVRPEHMCRLIDA